MAVTPGFLAYVVELFVPWAAIQTKRMFGGAGLYRDGRMFGLVADDQIYLKTTAETRHDFEAVRARLCLSGQGWVGHRDVLLGDADWGAGRRRHLENMGRSRLGRRLGSRKAIRETGPKIREDRQATRCVACAGAQGSAVETAGKAGP